MHKSNFSGVSQVCVCTRPCRGAKCAWCWKTAAARRTRSRRSTCAMTRACAAIFYVHTPPPARVVTSYFLAFTTTNALVSSPVATQADEASVLQPRELSRFFQCCITSPNQVSFWNKKCFHVPPPFKNVQSFWDGIEFNGWFGVVDGGVGNGRFDLEIEEGRGD